MCHLLRLWNRGPDRGVSGTQNDRVSPHEPIHAVQSGTVQRTCPRYAHRVKPIEPILTAEQRARIAQMIEGYRETKERRLLPRATDLWRKTEAHQRLVKFEAPPERVH
jgi:hypothetical protein